MRDYEVVFIVQPDLEESAIEEIIEKVKGWITTSGGSIDKVEKWGKRNLAYRIRKIREGYYVMIYAKIQPDQISEITRNFKFVETVMRSMITVVE
jgi:small subunit ribosomal protein S6